MTMIVHHDHGQGGVFAFRSGLLVLDFAATRMFRAGEESLELLTTPGMLAGWLVASGLLPQPPGCSDEELGEAVQLREAVYRFASARLSGTAPEASDLALLNRHGSRVSLAVALRADGTLVRHGTVPQALATLAREAIELFGSGDVERLRQCGRAGCTRLFIDKTRGGTRVWCGMRECGNRVNAAAYRRRRTTRRRQTDAAPDQDTQADRIGRR
jgi:predicted RNA-binding Zn ribbon-like protein